MSYPIQAHDATWLKERVHALQDQISRQQYARERDHLVLWILGVALFTHMIWERLAP